MASIKKTHIPSILSEPSAFMLLIIGLLSSSNNDLSASFINEATSISNSKNTIRKFSAKEDPEDYPVCPSRILPALNGFSNDSGLDATLYLSGTFNSEGLIFTTEEKKDVQLFLMNKVREDSVTGMYTSRLAA